jgi:hypothetical protein
VYQTDILIYQYCNALFNLFYSKYQSFIIPNNISFNKNISNVTSSYTTTLPNYPTTTIYSYSSTNNTSNSVNQVYNIIYQFFNQQRDEITNIQITISNQNSNINSFGIGFLTLYNNTTNPTFSSVLLNYANLNSTHTYQTYITHLINYLQNYLLPGYTSYSNTISNFYLNNYSVLQTYLTNSNLTFGNSDSTILLLTNNFTYYNSLNPHSDTLNTNNNTNIYAPVLNTGYDFYRIGYTSIYTTLQNYTSNLTLYYINIYNNYQSLNEFFVYYILFIKIFYNIFINLFRIYDKIS